MRLRCQRKQTLATLYLGDAEQGQAKIRHYGLLTLDTPFWQCSQR